MTPSPCVARVLGAGGSPTVPRAAGQGCTGGPVVRPAGVGSTYGGPGAVNMRVPDLGIPD
ncbi:hypothetical protein GCM10018781_33120 [Kitasatospora indigofera]|uniref:Uncharacterized protein n=1 Tax=Kitasatospora indigofera TaxID=67307 RepID=A0A919FU86_9ACTN|nr:hypothetical protein GCM10018781_33120 [Kitasatospora indigofera]